MPEYSDAGILLSPRIRTVSVGFGRRAVATGRPTVPLTPKAFDLLVYLVERHGRLVTKQELMSALWPDTFVEESNLPYTVSALRKALGDGQNGEQFIQTVPTRGYRFVAPVVVTAGIGRSRPRPRRRLVLSSLSFAKSRPSHWRLPSSPCCSSSSAICAKRRMPRRPRGSPSPCPTPYRPPLQFPCHRSRRTADVWLSSWQRGRASGCAISTAKLRLPIAGTEDTRTLFWAPDSRQLAFSTRIGIEEA